MYPSPVIHLKIGAGAVAASCEDVALPSHRNKVLGSWGWIMSVAAALSAFGSLNGTFFSGGRVCFVAAREGHMVRGPSCE